MGSNPWAREKRTHDLARICERYGGGGHPVVGAVSLPAEELERARSIAREIVCALQRQGWYALGTAWAGAEGQSLALWISDGGNRLMKVINDYWYQAPR